MNETVYVVTDTEAGWDNVIGVFTTKEKAIERIKLYYNNNEYNEHESSYVIHTKTLN